MWQTLADVSGQHAYWRLGSGRAVQAVDGAVQLGSSMHVWLEYSERIALVASPPPVPVGLGQVYWPIE